MLACYENWYFKYDYLLTYKIYHEVIPTINLWFDLLGNVLNEKSLIGFWTQQRRLFGFYTSVNFSVIYVFIHTFCLQLLESYLGEKWLTILFQYFTWDLSTLSTHIAVRFVVLCLNVIETASLWVNI